MGLRDILRQLGDRSGGADDLLIAPRPETALTVVRDDGSFAAEDGSTIYSRGYALVDPVGEFTQVGDDDWLRVSGCRLCKVAGLTHHAEAAQDERFSPGSVVLVCPDPSNPVDPSAVAVFDASGEHQVGFVPASISAEIAGRIAGGEELGGAILREYRTEPATGGRRIGLVMLIAPAGTVRLTAGRRPGEAAAPDQP
jgi:hypothetical protein